MSILKKPINFKVLENELNNALRADELYKLQNDAKIRAVEQRVPTYDNFRDMVLAAHLRPLERSEMQKRAEVSWNHCYSNSDESVSKGYGRSKQFVPKSKEHSGDRSLNLKPQTSVEFLKIWKNLSDSQQRFDYVFYLRNTLKSKFFKVEVPPEFLEEFFRVSLEICSIDTDLQIIEVLQIFSECNRISLSSAMMGGKEKQSIQLLFKKLLSLVQSHEELGRIKNLMKIFCI